MSDGVLILAVGAAMLAAIGGSVVAARLRIPALIIVLGVGMALGSDGAGLLRLDDYELARSVGIVALALILFDGGLRTGVTEIRSVLGPALALAIGGTVITAIVTGLAATVLFGLELTTGLLVGSILASTDGAAVFGLLRGSSLRRRLTLTLEGETGFNDPVAVLLVLGFIEWIGQPDYGLPQMLALFARELVIGTLCGVLVAGAAAKALRSVPLPRAGLYPVAALGVAAVAYGSADATGGSGFLAVYLAGLVLNEGDIPARQTMTVFHDGLAWLAQVALFLTLGLLVSPAGLGEVWREGVLLALVLMLVARPVAVTVALSHDAYSLSERAVLAWAGLRGAVPVVLATFAVTAGIAGSSRFFDIVFFTVVLSTLLQGTTFEPLARHLGLTAIAPSLPRPLADRATIRGLGAVVLEYGVGPGDGIVGRRIRDLGLPDGATVTVVVRGREALPPHGDTRVSAGDVLHLLAREEARAETTALFDGWGESTWEPRRTVAHPVLEKESLAAGAWGSDDGDPADPELVGGIAVVGRLRARADVAGALVALEDGRYAVTGASSVVGSLDGLRRYAHRRFETARNDSERGWWREVLGALGS